MKRYIAILAALICTIASCHYAAAQDKGRLSLGMRMAGYTRAKAFALGIYGNYGLTRWLDIEPGVNIMCKELSSVDIYCDLHVILELTTKSYIYPIVGISINQIGSKSQNSEGWSFAGALGAGFNYRLNHRWTTSAQCKWLSQTAANHRNPVVLSLGIEYMF
ncbi:MAG: hypothetical protein K2F95_08260 [Alistipes sp.]|nr:hypothetical protein [Alistipes sp.]MDE7129573.1 hypothetical protein [Alistipes sp.]